jgi:DNA-binding MarR family transcriptional regulator
MPADPIDEWTIVVELMHLYRDVMRITEQSTGMSKSRLEIMHDLMHVDEMSQADLARHLGVEGAVVTRIVKQLEAEGLVTRRADPRDNRYTLVALSAHARALNITDDAENFKNAFTTDLFDGLSTADRVELLRLLGHLQKNAHAIREATRS